MAKEYKDRKNTTRHYVLVVAVVVFGVSLGSLLMLHAYPYLQTVMRTHVDDDKVTPVVSSDIAVVSYERSLPVRLRIPSLGIDAPFEAPLTLSTDGSIRVPEAFDTVGWYMGGASPGEIGTASILGHVDSKEGPAVFFTIGQLSQGDHISIDRKDGTTATFVVQYIERYKQSEFPTERVYGMTEYSSLRLITCSGVYDKGSLRYSHNTVVYARLLPS
jgi:sortase (surface protein transpeptidase)